MIDQGFCVVEVLFDDDGRATDYRFLEVNAAFERQTGLASVVGERMRALRPEHEQAWFDIYGEIARTGEPRRFEYPADALGRWYEVYAFRIDDPAQHHVAILFDDVMRRKQAEAALSNSEERLRKFGEASDDVLSIRDAHTLQWTYLTPAFETIYGLAREEALSGDNYRSWLDLIVPEDRDQAAAQIARVKAGEHVTYEYRVRRPDSGEIRWLRNTDFPIEDASGSVSLIGGIGEDVTERKITQERIEYSEERLRSAIEIGRLGLWDWDIAGDKIHWSDEHFRMQGYAVGEIVPSYEAWASRLHPEDRAETEAALKKAMADRTDYARTFRVVHPNGSVHWLSARGRFSYDESGSAVRLIGAMVDVTDIRKSEERQRLLLAELQHRVRNLLGMIRGVAKETAKSYDKVGDYVDHFVGRLQAMGRTQGILTRRPGATVDLEDLVREELLAHAASDLVADIEGPEVALFPKTAEVLTLAVHELATNSIKYGVLGDSGELQITWSRYQRDDRPWVLFCWQEKTNFVASGDHRRGFGTELIEKRVPYELQGEGNVQVTSRGVKAKIAFPLQRGASILEPGPE